MRDVLLYVKGMVEQMQLYRVSWREDRRGRCARGGQVYGQ